MNRNEERRRRREVGRSSLTWHQRHYLTSATYQSDRLLRLVAGNQVGPDGLTTFELEASLAEEFRSEFTERLAAAGFDEAYELNQEGRLLEALIDAFED